LLLSLLLLRLELLGIQVKLIQSDRVKVIATYRLDILPKLIIVFKSLRSLVLIILMSFLLELSFPLLHLQQM